MVPRSIKQRQIDVKDVPRRKDALLLATDFRVGPLAALKWRMAKYLAFVYIPAWPAAPLAADVPKKDATLLYLYIQL